MQVFANSRKLSLHYVQVPLLSKVLQLALVSCPNESPKEPDDELDDWELLESLDWPNWPNWPDWPDWAFPHWLALEPAELPPHCCWLPPWLVTTVVTLVFLVTTVPPDEEPPENPPLVLEERAPISEPAGTLLVITVPESTGTVMTPNCRSAFPCCRVTTVCCWLICWEESSI